MAPASVSDSGARDRIEREFDVSFLVEAGAGSGKTRSLARRMAAGIAAGAYDVSRMAAVTFTRKAAAELRGRFQEALEERRRKAASDAERARVDAALRDLERLFAGTIHAFCAHLLRERPVESGVAPGFEELDEREDEDRRGRAWRDFIAKARAERSPMIAALQDAGVRPSNLDGAFAAVCQHQDVAFPEGGAPRPDIEPVWKALDRFWARLSKLIPEQADPEETCKVLEVAREFEPRYRYARRYRRTQPAALADLLESWASNRKVTLMWWTDGEEARRLCEAFKADVAAPFLSAWRQCVYRVVVPVLAQARDFYAAERRRQNIVNYVDLLSVAARLLRENAEVRRALQAKFRWLFIDEFQDTDPIQAEIFLMLAGDADGGLRPGSLFVVGDPKQSIYRFRRADIDIYNRVKARIQECGGEVLHLTANWRSLPSVCDLANTVFPPRFPAAATRESPVYEPLEATRPDVPAKAACGIVKLLVPADLDKAVGVVRWEAARIARYIRTEVDAGRRAYRSFLILARNTTRLHFYADELDALEIPVEVSGAGRFAGSAHVRALASVLTALADPADGAPLVAVLRGPLFGLSDAQFYAFRESGGRLDVFAPVPGAAFGDPAVRDALVTKHGPVLEALLQLQNWRRLANRLPLGAAVAQILEDTGWLALAAASPGGAHAGVLLQAVDRVRAVAEEGGGLFEAAEALVEGEGTTSGAEVLPLEPGRRDVVRLMNLHKAKGLEADVVFLADPAHGWEFPVVSRIVRDGDRAAGYLKIFQKFGRKDVLYARPAGWEAHEEAEQRYHDAERNRLLYVAATRARDLLVVGKWTAVVKKTGQTKGEAWIAFDQYVERVPELVVEMPEAGAGKTGAQAPKPEEKGSRAGAVRPAAGLSRKDRLAAEIERAARHDALRAPSWAVTTPTGEKARLAEAARAKEAAADAAAAAAVPDTPSHRADAGAAWGTLLHGLLEHAMRHATASRDDLARLALWLTVEHEDIRPFIEEALDVVESVRQMSFWQEAHAGSEVHVEVPFAVRVAPAVPDVGRGFLGLSDVEGSPGVQPVPVVLRGVIDVVYLAEGGWRILDYKSDQLDGMADVDAALMARYGPQLGQYRAAWERVTGGRVASADLVALRAKRTINRGPSGG